MTHELTCKVLIPSGFQFIPRYKKNSGVHRRVTEKTILSLKVSSYFQDKFFLNPGSSVTRLFWVNMQHIFFGIPGFDQLNFLDFFLLIKIIIIVTAVAL